MFIQILSQFDLPVLTAIAALGASFLVSIFRLSFILVRERRKPQ